jgi:hypothetical protein
VAIEMNSESAAWSRSVRWADRAKLRLSIVLATMTALFGFVVGSQCGMSRPPAIGPAPQTSIASSRSPGSTTRLSELDPVLFPQTIPASVPGGATCTLLSNSGGDTSLPFHLTWLFRCALSIDKRPALVSGLTARIATSVARGVVVSEIQDPKSPVIVDWWRYEATGVVGTIEFFGLPAGSDFDVVVVHTAAAP